MAPDLMSSREEAFDVVGKVKTSKTAGELSCPVVGHCPVQGRLRSDAALFVRWCRLSCRRFSFLTKKLIRLRACTCKCHRHIPVLGAGSVSGDFGQVLVCAIMALQPFFFGMVRGTSAVHGQSRAARD